MCTTATTKMSLTFFFLLLVAGAGQGLLQVQYCRVAAAAATRCAAPATTWPTTSPVSSYEKCVALPSQGATMAWTYHAHNATLSIAFTGTFISPSGWVAWGINPTSPQMVGARALVAFPDPVSGGLVLLPFLLDASLKRGGGPLLTRPLDIPLLNSSATLFGAADDRSSIRAGTDVEIRATLTLVPNRTHVHVVWNRGLYVQGYSPTVHPMSADDLASRATIDLLSSSAAITTVAAASVPDWLRTAHAVLNSISWGFLLPFGVVTARYLRQCSAAGPSWFYAHAAIQATGFLLGAIGFAIGLFMGTGAAAMHRGLGVAAVTAGGLQAAALFFRPATTNRYRKYWKSYHHLIGYGCVVVGVVNVFQGFGVMGVSGTAAELGYCSALAALVGAAAALEVNSWVVFCRKAEEEKIVRKEKEAEIAAGSSSRKAAVNITTTATATATATGAAAAAGMGF